MKYYNILLTITVLMISACSTTSYPQLEESDYIAKENYNPLTTERKKYNLSRYFMILNRDSENNVIATPAHKPVFKFCTSVNSLDNVCLKTEEGSYIKPKPNEQRIYVHHYKNNNHIETYRLQDVHKNKLL